MNAFRDLAKKNSYAMEHKFTRIIEQLLQSLLHWLLITVSLEIYRSFITYRQKLNYIVLLQFNSFLLSNQILFLIQFCVLKSTQLL